MKTNYTNCSVWHLINDPDPTRGGAQRILELLQSSAAQVFSKQSSGGVFTKFLPKRMGWVLLLTLRTLSKPPQVVYIHSRCFLPFVFLFNLLKVRTVFYGHAHYRSGNWLFTLFRCKEYIAVSNSVKSHFVELGISTSKIEVIYNPYMGGEYFQPPPHTTSQLKFGSVGGLYTWKGFDKAFELLEQFSKNSKLAIQYKIVGRGPELGNLSRLASDLSPRINIELLGYKKSPYAHLIDTPIIIIPSLEEGFGLIAIEAIFQGKILLFSDIPALREICSNDPISFAFDVHSSDSFSSALNSAITSLSKIENTDLIENRKAYVLKNFGMDRFLKSHQVFLARQLQATSDTIT